MKQLVNRSIWLKVVGVSVGLLMVFALLWQSSRVRAGATINLTEFVGFVFNGPIGIDFHEPTGKLIVTRGYPSGTPHNLDLVAADGTVTQFSNLVLLENELKVATVRSGPCMGGFPLGEVFTGNGDPGQIVRISATGSSVQNPWVILPGETALIRGSLFQDRYCAAGGNLIVVSGNEQNNNPANDNVGRVWRVNSAGVATLVANIGTHLEGVVTVPNNPTVYGPLAGKILAGAEHLTIIGGVQQYVASGQIYVVDPNAFNSFFTIGSGAGNLYQIGLDLHPEDIDIITKDAEFFGIAFRDGKILTAGSADFANMCGQILVTQEFPAAGTSGLATLTWDGSGFQAMGLISNRTIQQWEHVTFKGGDVCFVPPPPPGVSHGCTPGFWKNHANNPPWGNYTPLQKVNTIFTIPSCIPSKAAFENETLLDALQGGGGSGLDGKTRILLRAATAAVLNADNGNPPYPLSVAQIISQTNAALASCDETTITNLATLLDNYNNRCDTR